MATPLKPFQMIPCCLSHWYQEMTLFCLHEFSCGAEFMTGEWRRGFDQRAYLRARTMTTVSPTSVVFKNKGASPEVQFSPTTDKCREKKQSVFGISSFLGKKWNRFHMIDADPFLTVLTIVDSIMTDYSCTDVPVSVPLLMSLLYVIMMTSHYSFHHRI